MIVIDASAVVAILCVEEGHERYLEKIETAASRELTLRMSTVSVWEAAIAIARIRRIPRTQALQDLEAFMLSSQIESVAPSEDITRLAVDASERYGFGNAQGYPGILNMGDTFSYATARYFSAKLVCKGEDFKRTDIEIA